MSGHRAVIERVGPLFTDRPNLRYHLTDGPADDAVTFQPILCAPGEGIAFPGYEYGVAWADLCADCRTAHAARRRQRDATASRT